MDKFLRNRFTYRYNVIPVYSRGTSGNSAEFRVFEDEAFEMGVEGLCGCSIVVIVSTRAIWFAHLL
jgi:hypothetical protein